MESFEPIVTESISTKINNGVVLLDKTLCSIESKIKEITHWEDLEEEKKNRIKDIMITGVDLLIAAGAVKAFDTQIIQKIFEMDSQGGGALLSLSELFLVWSRGCKALIHGWMAMRGRPAPTEDLTNEDMDHLSLIDLLIPKEKRS